MQAQAQPPVSGIHPLAMPAAATAPAAHPLAISAATAAISQAAPAASQPSARWGTPGALPAVSQSTYQNASEGLNVTGLDYEKAHEDLSRAAMASLTGQSVQPNYAMPVPQLPMPARPPVPPAAPGWYMPQAAPAPVRPWPAQPVPPQPPQPSAAAAQLLYQPAADAAAYHQAYAAANAAAAAAAATATPPYSVHQPAPNQAHAVSGQYTQPAGAGFGDGSQQQSTGYPAAQANLY
eukprot:evm.model.scf_1277.3 EVM.evm.TU.scf_1277.3   scf_1277:44224-45766(-)